MAWRQGFATAYLDPLAVEQRFAALPGRFPDLCRLEQLPFATNGYRGVRADLRGPRAMHVLRVGSPEGAAAKPAVLVMRSPHAREWINGIAVVELAEQLLGNYRPDDPDPHVQTLVHMLDRVDFLIVPEGNPDGALFSFFDPGRRMWRKNLRVGNGGCFGVDCNRNYPTFFGAAGASADPCTEIYHGPHALSEPESANIADLVERDRRILFAIDSHSSGPAFFRPNPTGGTHVAQLPVTPADDAVYRNLETAMTQAIGAAGGPAYATGSTSNHAGTSDEHFFFAHGIFGFDLECGTDFQPPVPAALAAAKEVTAAALALGRCAAGETGLDIEGLLARRAAMPAQPVTPPDAPADFADAAPPEELPPERWRRYRVAIAPTAPDRVAADGLALLARGYDVDEHLHEAISAILSEEELDILRSEGRRVSVLVDLETEPVAVGEPAPGA